MKIPSSIVSPHGGTRSIAIAQRKGHEPHGALEFVDGRPSALRQRTLAAGAQNSSRMMQLSAQSKAIQDSLGTFQLTQLSQLASNSLNVVFQRKSQDYMAGIALTDGGAEVVQRIDTQMSGPPSQLPHGGTSDDPYPGHDVDIPASNGSDCANGTLSIVTAGERLDPNAQSDPGTPTDLPLYNNRKQKKWYSRRGGLARDKSMDKAAASMHAINHHFDPGATQGISANIFMGTMASNNPNHLHLVEKPILDSIEYLGDNAAYEDAMDDAEDSVDAVNGDAVLYWPGSTPAAAGIDPAAVKHTELKDCVADSTNVGAGVTINGMNSGGTDEDGQALVLGPNTPTSNFYHGYVEYRITPNYGNIPAYLNNNIAVETTAQTNAPNVNRANGLANFPHWAADAFAENFHAEVTYYTASYRYQTQDLYYTHHEADDYSTDI